MFYSVSTMLTMVNAAFFNDNVDVKRVVVNFYYRKLGMLKGSAYRKSIHIPILEIRSKTLLSILVGTLMYQSALADIQQKEEDLPTLYMDKITVYAKKNPPINVGDDIKTAKTISDNLIDSNKDLVRYNPDISVSDAGRYGSNGYAIRGVDGNRVALNLDGVSLPDKQVNEIFSAYGYMFEGRLSPDVEILSEVAFEVGSDSFNSGSGAMGGAVSFKTKDPEDLIKPNRQLGGYAKTGYSSSNEEISESFGLAGRNDKLEAIINYVHRRGHETKNHRMIGFDKEKLNPAYDFINDPDYAYPRTGYRSNTAAILPDPLTYETEAALAKLYVHLNEESRLGFHATKQKTDTLSNNFSRKTFSPRIGKDNVELDSYGISHRYIPSDSELIDQIDTNLNYQKVKAAANTETYSQDWGTDNYRLDGLKHRPQIDKTLQLSIAASSFPVQTEKFGEHIFSVNTKYAKKDHKLILEESFIPSSGTTESWYDFLGPSVKQDVFNIAVQDKINLTDKLDTVLGIRYDHYNYKPYMDEINKKGIEKSSKYYPVRIAYENGEFDHNKTMSNIGGMFSVNYELTPDLQAQYQISTGFMAPATSQMYSAFEMMGNSLTPNFHLKPEKSLNHEISLRGEYKDFSFKATGFYTKYSDFISLLNYQEEQERCYEDYSSGKPVCSPHTVNMIGAKNIGNAKTYGIRLGGMWDIAQLVDTEGDIKVFANLNYAKDESDKGTNLLATQPLNAMLGIGYQSSKKDWQLSGNLRYLGRKHPNDAKVVNLKFNGFNSPSQEYIAPYKHIDRSKSAYVYDVYGSKKIGSQLKLSAGIFNLFNTNYVPWDSLRSLAELNVNSMVDDKGVGIERFTAPGRNYKVGLTYEF